MEEIAAAVFGSRQLLSVVALVISAVALWLSFRAYRRQVIFHPQPKLIVEWEDRLIPTDGLLFRAGKVFNRGDAPARDVRVSVEFAVTEPWTQMEVLEPGKFLYLTVPVVDRVRTGEGSAGTFYDRDGDKSDYTFVTPLVRLTWRQPPFGGKVRSLRSRPPHTPSMLKGETS